MIVKDYLMSWWQSIVVRPPVLYGELFLSSCARLMGGRVTTLWVKRPLSVNQHGQLSQPSLWGRLNEYSNSLMMGYCWLALPVTGCEVAAQTATETVYAGCGR